MTSTNVAGARPDNRLTAQQNELSVLKLVAHYGHLRRIEIARGVWPGSKIKIAEKMTYRTVRRLVGYGQLQDKPNSLGGHSLALTHRGVARLRSLGLAARDGYDLSSVSGPHFYHRTLGTRYLLERSACGHEAHGEYALFTGRAPVSVPELRNAFGKFPDGLVLTSSGERDYPSTVRAADWIEVESSYKAERDLFRIFDVAWKVGTWLNRDESVVLDRVVLVYDEALGHEHRIIASLRRYLRDHSATDAVLASIVFARCQLSLPLVWKRHDEFSYHSGVAPRTTDHG